MLMPVECYRRGCKHYRGITQPDGTEVSERPCCAAFPNGIPEDIAWGDNPHTGPVPGDNGTQFAKGPRPD